MNDKTDIKEFIRNRMITIRQGRSNALSARELSAKLNLNENYINQIENGKTLPSYEILNAFCHLYQITLSEFFDERFYDPVDHADLLKLIAQLNQEQLNALMTIAELFLKK